MQNQQQLIPPLKVQLTSPLHQIATPAATPQPQATAQPRATPQLLTTQLQMPQLIQNQQKLLLPLKI